LSSPPNRFKQHQAQKSNTEKSEKKKRKFFNLKKKKNFLKPHPTMLSAVVLLEGVPAGTTEETICADLDICGAVAGVAWLGAEPGTGPVRVTFASAVGAQTAHLLSPIVINSAAVTVRDVESGGGGEPAVRGPRMHQLGDGVVMLETEATDEPQHQQQQQQRESEPDSEKGGILDRFSATLAPPLFIPFYFQLCMCVYVCVCLCMYVCVF
jgi:hypothetical protein